LMCYPLDTVRRQMQMKGTPYNTVFDAIPGSYFFLEYAGELRIIALIERIERGIESWYRTHTHTTYSR
jgi:hypothetical protein